MTDGAILDLLREALWVSVLISTPLLAAALVVGVGVGLLQALTSVQELTLTFVPKLAAMGVIFWVSMGTMGGMLVELYQNRIIPMIVGS